jgi:hypothetical protein
VWRQGRNKAFDYVSETFVKAAESFGPSAGSQVLSLGSTSNHLGGLQYGEDDGVVRFNPSSAHQDDHIRSHQTPRLGLSPEGKLSCPATIKLKMNKNRTKLKIHGQPFK